LYTGGWPCEILAFNSDWQIVPQLGVVTVMWPLYSLGIIDTISEMVQCTDTVTMED